MDVLQALRNLKPLCQRHTRVLVTTYNHLWEPLVTFAEWIGMKVPRTEQNWLSTADIRNLLKLAGFEALETHRIVLLPKYLPLVVWFPESFLCAPAVSEQALHDAGGRCANAAAAGFAGRACGIGRHSMQKRERKR